MAEPSVRYLVERDSEGPGYLVVRVTREIVEYGHPLHVAQRVAEGLRRGVEYDGEGGPV